MQCFTEWGKCTAGRRLAQLGLVCLYAANLPFAGRLVQSSESGLIAQAASVRRPGHGFRLQAVEPSACFRATLCVSPERGLPAQAVVRLPAWCFTHGAAHTRASCDLRKRDLLCL